MWYHSRITCTETSLTWLQNWSQECNGLVRMHNVRHYYEVLYNHIATVSNYYWAGVLRFMCYQNIIEFSSRLGTEPLLLILWFRVCKYREIFLTNIAVYFISDKWTTLGWLRPFSWHAKISMNWIYFEYL